MNTYKSHENYVDTLCLFSVYLFWIVHFLGSIYRFLDYARIIFQKISLWISHVFNRYPQGYENKFVSLMP